MRDVGGELRFNFGRSVSEAATTNRTEAKVGIAPGMIFGPQFSLLSQEASLTKAALLAGLTSLSKANYDQKGDFYSTFFQISIGLERLMKIVVIVDYKLHNQLRNPADKQLRAIGHGIGPAYEKCKELARARGLEMSHWFESGSLERDVIDFFSSFADGSRYYNLDALAGAAKHVDPVVQWSRLHRRIAEAYLSYRARQRINDKAIAFADKNRLFGYEQAIDGQWIPQVDGLYLHEVFRRANPYCVWTLIRILKPFYFLIDKLTDEVHGLEINRGIGSPTVPYLIEFFPFFLCDIRTATRRKNWTSVCT